jgi:multisubunit Na+/H+ antiporter MnhF subunit
MIDTWLLAVFCLMFLSICAILRVIRGSTPDDQFVGVTTAVTITAGAALALSISWGNLFVLDVSIILSALCYTGIIAYARSLKGDTI